MNALDEWVAVVREALDLGEAGNDRDLVLDLARDVAHNVLRPAAPLTAYLVGIAVGRGVDPAAAAAIVTALARDWPSAEASH
jgi:hypothetical protein